MCDLFNAQPQAPATRTVATTGVAGACGWALNDLLADELQPGLLECLGSVTGILECFFKCLGLGDQFRIER